MIHGLGQITCMINSVQSKLRHIFQLKTSNDNNVDKTGRRLASENDLSDKNADRPKLCLETDTPNKLLKFASYFAEFVSVFINTTVHSEKDNLNFYKFNSYSCTEGFPQFHSNFIQLDSDEGKESKGIDLLALIEPVPPRGGFGDSPLDASLWKRYVEDKNGNMDRIPIQKLNKLCHLSGKLIKSPSKIVVQDCFKSSGEEIHTSATLLAEKRYFNNEDPNTVKCCLKQAEPEPPPPTPPPPPPPPPPPEEKKDECVKFDDPHSVKRISCFPRPEPEKTDQNEAKKTCCREKKKKKPTTSEPLPKKFDPHKVERHICPCFEEAEEKRKHELSKRIKRDGQEENKTRVIDSSVEWREYPTEFNPHSIRRDACPYFRPKRTEKPVQSCEPEKFECRKSDSKITPEVECEKPKKVDSCNKSLLCLIAEFFGFKCGKKK